MPSGSRPPIAPLSFLLTCAPRASTSIGAGRLALVHRAPPNPARRRAMTKLEEDGRIDSRTLACHTEERQCMLATGYRPAAHVQQGKDTLATPLDVSPI